MAAAERRKGDRVTFERGFTAHMMGIDGTWRRDCVMEDVSETGGEDHGFGRRDEHLRDFSNRLILCAADHITAIRLNQRL